MVSDALKTLRASLTDSIYYQVKVQVKGDLGTRFVQYTPHNKRIAFVKEYKVYLDDDKKNIKFKTFDKKSAEFIKEKVLKEFSNVGGAVVCAITRDKVATTVCTYDYLQDMSQYVDDQQKLNVVTSNLVNNQTGQKVNVVDAFKDKLKKNARVYATNETGYNNSFNRFKNIVATNPFNALFKTDVGIGFKNISPEMTASKFFDYLEQMIGVELVPVKQADGTSVFEEKYFYKDTPTLSGVAKAFNINTRELLHYLSKDRELELRKGNSTHDPFVTVYNTPKDGFLYRMYGDSLFNKGFFYNILRKHLVNPLNMVVLGANNNIDTMSAGLCSIKELSDEQEQQLQQKRVVVLEALDKSKQETIEVFDFPSNYLDSVKFFSEIDTQEELKETQQRYLSSEISGVLGECNKCTGVDLNTTDKEYLKPILHYHEGFNDSQNVITFCNHLEYYVNNAFGITKDMEEMFKLFNGRSAINYINLLLFLVKDINLINNYENSARLVNVIKGQVTKYANIDKIKPELLSKENIKYNLYIKSCRLNGVILEDKYNKLNKYINLTPTQLEDLSEKDQYILYRALFEVKVTDRLLPVHNNEQFLNQTYKTLSEIDQEYLYKFQVYKSEVMDGVVNDLMEAPCKDFYLPLVYKFNHIGADLNINRLHEILLTYFRNKKLDNVTFNNDNKCLAYEVYLSKKYHPQAEEYINAMFNGTTQNSQSGTPNNNDNASRVKATDTTGNKYFYRTVLYYSIITNKHAKHILFDKNTLLSPQLIDNYINNIYLDKLLLKTQLFNNSFVMVFNYLSNNQFNYNTEKTAINLLEKWEQSYVPSVISDNDNDKSKVGHSVDDEDKNTANKKANNNNHNAKEQDLISIALSQKSVLKIMKNIFDSNSSERNVSIGYKSLILHSFFSTSNYYESLLFDLLDANYSPLNATCYSFKYSFTNLSINELLTNISPDSIINLVSTINIYNLLNNLFVSNNIYNQAQSRYNVHNLSFNHHININSSMEFKQFTPIDGNINDIGINNKENSPEFVSYNTINYFKLNYYSLAIEYINCSMIFKDKEILKDGKATMGLSDTIYSFNSSNIIKRPNTYNEIKRNILEKAELIVEELHEKRLPLNENVSGSLAFLYNIESLKNGGTWTSNNYITVDGTPDLIKALKTPQELRDEIEAIDILPEEIMCIERNTQEDVMALNTNATIALEAPTEEE